MLPCGVKLVASKPMRRAPLLPLLLQANIRDGRLCYPYSPKQTHAAGAFATPTPPGPQRRPWARLPPGAPGAAAPLRADRWRRRAPSGRARPGPTALRAPRPRQPPGSTLPAQGRRALRFQSRAYSIFVWLDHAQYTQRKEEQTTFFSMPAAGPPDQIHPRHQQRSACRCACRHQGAAQRGCPAACLRSALHQMS